MSHPDTVLLRSTDTAVLFDLSGRLPAIAHWGRAIGETADLAQFAITGSPDLPHSSPDAPRVFTTVPTEFDQWSGTPGLALASGGHAVALRLGLTGVDQSGSSVELRLVDAAAGVEVAQRFALHASGILEVTARVTNLATAALEVSAVRALLPLPSRAAEILDQTGRWSHERVPQRTAVRDGIHHRLVRRGRPGHDSPILTVVGAPGFGFRHGEVWSMHVAFSGDQEWLVERLPEGAGALDSVLGGGELLRTGEVRLDAGQSYESAALLFAWSGDGLDGLSRKYHALVRSFASDPKTPRPLVLNTWEAVYFDHDAGRLFELAERAASVGVERFVLDDGWFLGRHNDRAGLGDWTVDRATWPDGLGAIAEKVHGLGMEFGLWFEPEMVNLDSEVARAHPDWVLAPSVGPNQPWRNQFVLNLGIPEVAEHIFEAISALVSQHSIDFIKWDHNRDLVEAVFPADGAPAVHAQTLATYAVLDRLLERHPGLEIESCASGGARVDLGILRRTHRIWASDTNDPIERQAIQRWVGLLVPPELVGSHVGPAESHTTGRVTDLSFRMATALFPHPGIELDLTRATDDELRRLTAWSALYRSKRALLHAGITVNADLLDPSTLLHGIVSPDRSAALYAWVAVAASARAHSERVLLPGLDAARRYAVRVLDDLGSASRHSRFDPAWVASARSEAGIVLSGELLTVAGVAMPVLNPGHALLFEVVEAGRRHLPGAGARW